MSHIQHSNEPTTENFRDRIATVDDSGKRKWIFAYQPKGRFYSIRTVLSLFYFVIFFGLPFIQIDGRPLFFGRTQGFTTRPLGGKITPFTVLLQLPILYQVVSLGVVIEGRAGLDLKSFARSTSRPQ